MIGAEGVHQVEDDVGRPPAPGRPRRLRGLRVRLGGALLPGRDERRPAQDEAASRRRSGPVGHGHEGEPDRIGARIRQRDGRRSAVLAQAGHLPLLAPLGPPEHSQLSRLAAAGAQVVDGQHRPGREVLEGAEARAERQGEPVAGRAHAARLVRAGLEAEEVPGHGGAAAALLPGRAGPGVAQHQAVLPGPQVASGESHPGLQATARRGEAAHRLAIEEDGHPLGRCVRGGVGGPPEGEGDVARRGEEELELRLRTVAPDEGPAVLGLVRRPPLAQQRPRLRRAHVHHPGLALDLRQVHVGDQVAHRRLPRLAGRVGGRWAAAAGQEAERGAEQEDDGGAAESGRGRSGGHQKGQSKGRSGGL